MGYIQTVTNDEGEILGTETIYEDEDYGDDYPDYDDGPWDGPEDYEEE